MKSVLPTVLGLITFIVVLTATSLIGCENADKPVDEISNAVVESKSDNGSRFDRFHITLVKDGESIDLEVNSQSEYKAIKVGSTVNVSYNKEYTITELSFPNLSDDDKGVAK